MNKLVFSLFFILNSVLLFSQNKVFNTDTSAIPIDSSLENISHIDSILFQSWYVKTSLTKFHDLDSVRKLDHHRDISDSVIIERLKKINTVIPLAFNKEVRNWIDLYLKKDRMIPVYLGLGEYYFPIFEEILDKYELPYDLKYLPIIESALNPTVKSRAGAVGLWQLMYGTALLFQLEVNDFVDERRDVLKSTEAAAKFLKQMYNRYGDWLLVLAAYNCGPGNVDKAIRRSKKTDFWDIYDYLPRETRSYVPAFIAITYIMHYHNEHNYFPVKIEMPLNTDTIMIHDSLHLLQVATVLNLPLKMLEDLNPQYRKDIIPGYWKPYPLRLPVENISNFIELRDSIFNYKRDSLFNKRLIVKNRRENNYVPCNKNIAGKKLLYYEVKSGDVMSNIAVFFNVSVRDLKCWNNKTSSYLRAGEKLKVYVPSSKYAFYLNKMNKQRPAAVQQAHFTPTDTKPKDNRYVYHRVRRGQTIYDIAKLYADVSYQDIMKINGFSERDARTLREGQYIKIKRK